MSDDIDKEKEPEEESFANLFESYSAGMKDDLKVGDKVRARIISIGKDSVFFNTGTKGDGVADLAELLDKDGHMPYQPGDEIELYVVSQDEHEFRLSRAISGAGGVEILKDAFTNAIPVEGRVSATCKGGFHVGILQRRAFCPVSQIDVKFVKAAEDYVGQTFQFLITQFDEKGRNIVVSRRKLLAQAIEKEKEAFLATLKVGDLLEGRVARLMPYGIFVELIPGVEGMVHVSELSWSRVQKPDEIVQVNDKVAVKVLDIGGLDKKNQKKISLSMKQASGNPWETVSEKINVGDKVSGKVIRCTDFGAFVEIAPGIEGLVHVSELSYVKRIIRPEDVVKPGDIVSVLIKDLDINGRRISLSIRDAEGDPWLEVPDKFRVGQLVTGTLEKKEKFGYFISLAPGITGLLPKSKISTAQKPVAIEALKVGDPITVAIDAIRTQERKISLSPGDGADEDSWKNFAQVESRAPAGDLAEKLKQAISEKNNK